MPGYNDSVQETAAGVRGAAPIEGAEIHSGKIRSLRPLAGARSYPEKWSRAPASHRAGLHTHDFRLRYSSRSALVNEGHQYFSM
jgi:hypothetical protein